jgi:hypothetical protein
VTEDTQRLLDIYAFVKSALELCQAEVIKAREPNGNAEILAITVPMAEDFSVFWADFRAKWGIPDHPFAEEITEGGEPIA